jgi:hypothetical protein
MQVDWQFSGCLMLVHDNATSCDLPKCTLHGSNQVQQQYPELVAAAPASHVAD